MGSIKQKNKQVQKLMQTRSFFCLVSAMLAVPLMQNWKQLVPHQGRNSEELSTKPFTIQNKFLHITLGGGNLHWPCSFNYSANNLPWFNTFVGVIMQTSQLPFNSAIKLKIFQNDLELRDEIVRLNRLYCTFSTKMKL